MSTRTATLTQKVPTPFGNLYAHLEHADGKVLAVSFSSPGKFSETSVGDALDALGAAVTDAIADIGDPGTGG